MGLNKEFAIEKIDLELIWTVQAKLVQLDFWNNSLRIIAVVKQRRWCPIYECVINCQWLITIIIK